MKVLMRVAVGLMAAAWVGLGNSVKAAERDWDVMIGAGPAVEPKYEGADEVRPTAMPIIEIKWRDRVFLSARDGLGWNAYRTPNFRIGPVANYYQGSGGLFGQEDRPTGLNDIEGGFQVGGFAEFAAGHWKLDATLLQAVSGSSEGARLNMGAAYGMKVNGVGQVVLRADTTYANGNEMQTYFGINAREASDSRLPGYDPDGGFKDVGLGLDVLWGLGAHWRLVGRLKGSYLLGEAADSPIVDQVGSPMQVYAGMGLAYQF